MFGAFGFEGRLLPTQHCTMRNLLPTLEQRVYDHICAAMAKQKRTVVIPGGVMTGDVSRVLEVLFKEQPLLYYVDRRKTTMAVGLGRFTVSWDFNVEDCEIDRYDQLILQALGKLPLSRSGNELQRAVCLHDMFQRSKIVTGVGSWEDHCIIGPLVRGHAVCEGMAMLYSMLCFICGVKSIVISGRATNEMGTGPHAWNLVRLGSSYVHMDVYWDLLLRSKENPGYCYDYMNLCDEHIQVDHQWDRAQYPACPLEKYSYFVFRKCHADSMDEYEKVVRMCHEKGKTAVTARMGFRYDASRCVEIIRHVYRDYSPFTCIIRSNKQMGVFEVYINRV